MEDAQREVEGGTEAGWRAYRGRMEDAQRPVVGCTEAGCRMQRRMEDAQRRVVGCTEAGCMMHRGGMENAQREVEDAQRRVEDAQRQVGTVCLQKHRLLYPFMAKWRQR